MIRAGNVHEIKRDFGQWVFVDLGFPQSAKSCGLLIDDGEPTEVTFSDLVRDLTIVTAKEKGPLNLLLEAPLSVAFQANGNPTGRSIERNGSKTRYWYVGLGCSVIVSATYLLRTILKSKPVREIVN